MDELISRQAAIDAVNGLIDRFEQILRDIREANGDDSACGMCEYDGAYIGQSGDWCNECPGFDKEDCFKLSDECRKRWLKSVELPSAQLGTNCSEFPNNSDAISRQAAIDALREYIVGKRCPDDGTLTCRLIENEVINKLPPIQPQRMRAKWIATTALQEGQITWRDYKCSNCSHHRGKPMNFCEVCGAKMER